MLQRSQKIPPPPPPGPERGEQPCSGRAHRGWRAAPHPPPFPILSRGPGRRQPGSKRPQPGASLGAMLSSPRVANCSISLAGAECWSRPRANGRKQTNTLNPALSPAPLLGEPDGGRRRGCGGRPLGGRHPPARRPAHPGGPPTGAGGGPAPPGAAPRARLYLHRACPCVNAARRGLSQGPSVSRSLSAAPGEGWPFPSGSALIYVRTAGRRGRPRTTGTATSRGEAAGPGAATRRRGRRWASARPVPACTGGGHLPAAGPPAAKPGPARRGTARRSARSRAVFSLHRTGELRGERARSSPPQ